MRMESMFCSLVLYSLVRVSREPGLTVMSAGKIHVRLTLEHLNRKKDIYKEKIKGKNPIFF